MRLRYTILLLACLVSLPQMALAQQEEAAEPLMSTLEAIHDITEDFLIESAEMMDEDMLAYRPSVNVRTAAQIFGHIINAQFGICTVASGKENPSEGNYEEIATTKEQIVKALKASFKYCRAVYAEMTDEESMEMVTFFGDERRQEMTKASVMSFNSTHNYEHYGQLTVYMRINGMTPPSSAN